MPRTWRHAVVGRAAAHRARRVFLAAPRVLILDEATSSLDLATERIVERALDVLLEGRTAILIAHRLNTAMRADRIAVVENGSSPRWARTKSSSRSTVATRRCSPRATVPRGARLRELRHRSACRRCGSVGSMDGLPRTTAVLNEGIARGLHLGVQGYVWHAGAAVADFGIGEARGVRSLHVLLDDHVVLDDQAVGGGRGRPAVGTWCAGSSTTRWRSTCRSSPPTTRSASPSAIC